MRTCVHLCGCVDVDVDGRGCEGGLYACLSVFISPSDVFFAMEAMCIPTECVKPVDV